MKKYFFIFNLLILNTIFLSSFGQANVLDPNDPDLIFTSTNQPAVPTYNKISKWGHTNRLGWNPFTYGYKSYYFKGMAFRIKFPKTYAHNVVDNKIYPSIIFFHGLGEPGNIWDNELQLVHGGQVHAQKINDGTFDGFMIYPQSQSGYLQSYFPVLKDLVDSLTKYVKLDIDRINIGGLSGGGQAVWDFPQQQLYAKMICALEPISAARYENVQYFDSYKTIPVFLANGGLDVAPYPATVTDIINSYKNLGGNIMQSFFPDQGHGVWNSFWADARYWPFINAQHKANPLVFFQQDKFCPNAAVNAKLGLQAGFYAYEWDQNGVTILGQTTNELSVTSYGTYRGRFKRTATNAWSLWSPTPVVIRQNQPTVSPQIQVNGLKSNVLPAPDGSSTVPLTVPNNYISYDWRRVSDSTLVNTTYLYNAPIGDFKIKVTEQFGCGSNFSLPYSVISADGINKPDPASSVGAIAISNNAIQLNWNDNPNPTYNETSFEIYRSNLMGKGYLLIGKTGADVLMYLDQGLSANTKYYYLIRAINLTAASANSTEVFATTQTDITAPSSPGNLKVTGTTRSSVSLSWDVSTDDVGVTKYEVYLNGKKSYVTVNNFFNVNSLNAFSTYSFFVKAVDASGNLSPASNQVNATASLNGLTYKYYEGNWNILPDFSALTPTSKGFSKNVTLAPRFKDVQFGFLWEGTINIPVTGTYTFETSSDDGSKLYIGNYNYSATPLVNNDGLHGAQLKGGTINLNAGIYPIAMTFFQQGGGWSMQVYWTCVAAGINTRTLIPDSAFGDNIVIPANLLPNKPADLNVSATDYNKIGLSWSDLSTNESGFEVLRSTSATGTFINIGTTAEGVTTFIDSIGLAPTTKYWYKVRSVNNYGQSEFVSILEAKWSLNNSFNDESGNSRNLTGIGSPIFNSTDKIEGTHSISLNGSSQYINLPFSTTGIFPANAYSTRSVGIWLKPSSIMLAAATVNKIIYDFGGSDNGMSLRFDAGSLQAGISSNNARFSIKVNSLTANSNWVLNGWNHISFIYNKNNITLYINGVQVGTTNLSFNSVSNSTNTSRIGGSSGTNAFNSSSNSTNYGGLIDEIVITNEPLNSISILSLMKQSYPAATTFALPIIPVAPSNLFVVDKTTNSITLSFNDNSDNETLFEVYRSVTNLNNYRLLSIIPGGPGTTKNFIDSNLFSNSNYYYKVRAKGIGGTTNYTPDVLVRTNDNRPVLTRIKNFSVRYSSQKTLSLTASDIDAEILTYSFVNPLPSFAVFTNTTNGSGILQFNPLFSDIGVYSVSVIVTDGNAGSDTSSLTITVNDNYTPVIVPISNMTIAENTNTNINLSATDQDGNSTLTWALASTNSFVNLIDNGNGAAVISLTPGFANAGVYQITAVVTDGAGANESVSFSLTVTNVEPPVEKWFLSIKGPSAAAALPWNNIAGTTTNNILNGNGSTTTVGIDFLNTGWNVGDQGSVTGNNSGVYPDAVIKDYFWFGAYNAPATVDANLKGLTLGAKYNLTIFGSSAWTGLGNNGTTIYTINNVSKPLYIDKNSQNTVSFSAISPDSAGNITLNLSKAIGSPYGAINAIVLEKPFDDGTVPMVPTNLNAKVLLDGTIRLDWIDVAYNEGSYLVYRATLPAGPFTLLNPTASNANDVTYIDNTVLSATSYYYKIAASNTNGISAFSNTVMVTSSNKAPLLAAIADIYVKATNSFTFNFAATDDAGDILTSTVTGLPLFGTFQSTGNGTGSITFNPSVNDLGDYNGIIIKVIDNVGASVTRTFNLKVTDNSVRSAYLNFGPDGATAQPAPWNNYLGYPFINNVYSNIMDDANVLTGFTFKFLTQWNGGYSIGMRTGNNKGVFPDNVMRTCFYNQNPGTHTIQFDGLNPAKRYSLGFLSNINTGVSQQVTFTSGTQSTLIDARYNTSALANLNGLIPDASGSIQVSIAKDAANAFLCLNGVVIREYNASEPVIKPADLIAETVIETNKIKLTWSDRSNDETGFEIWRSTAADVNYTLVTTTDANVSTFINTGLIANTRYFYKLRSVNGTATSNFSNVANAILAQKIVLINQNVNVAQAAPLPWNNTSSLSSVGATFSNLKNTDSINSGFEMVITKEFNGAGYAGVNVNGVFPASVMVSNYWTDAGQTSQVKFQNLDISKSYRIGCFGSNTNNDYTTANYSCNGRTVELNSYFNDKKVVFIDNLKPGGNGELYLNVNTAGGSPYSFTGAYTIEYFDDSTNNPIINTIYENQPAVTMRNSNNGVPAMHHLPEISYVAKKIVESTKNNFREIKVYPNPFTSFVQVDIPADNNSKVNIVLYDTHGQSIYSKNGQQLLKGNNTITAKISESTKLPAGVYFMSIIIDGKINKIEKLIKVN